MNVLLSAPIGAPIPFPTGWLPGAGTVPLAAVSVFSWDEFTAAERLACDLRTEGHAVHVVSHPEGDGCALVCRESDAKRVHERLRRVGADRPAVPVDPAMPGGGERVSRRSTAPPKTGWHGLFALFHLRGVQWEQRTGQDWKVERKERIKELIGEERSSTALTYDELSILTDQLTADLAQDGFDVDADNAAYRASRRQASARQAAGVSSPTPREGATQP